MPVRACDPAYLREAIDSVFNQTDSRWRVLVIAEAGELETLAVAHRPYLADPRASLIVNEGRRLAGALNTGMRAAGTEFTATLLADDLWELNAVEVLNAHIHRHPEVDFFHSSRRVIDDDGAAISDVYAAEPVVRPQDFLTWSPVKHLLCWRVRTALAFGGMDEALPSIGTDDWDFPWCMAEHGARFMAIADCLYLYRDHRRGHRLSTHIPLSVWRRGIRRIMRKHGVGRSAIRERVALDRATYLRQCLYGSRVEQWLRRTAGREPANVWRETYR